LEACTRRAHVCREGSKIEGEGRVRAQRGWYRLGALDPRGSGFRKSMLFGVKVGFKRLLRNLLVGLVRVMLVSTCQLPLGAIVSESRRAVV